MHICFFFSTACMIVMVSVILEDRGKKEVKR